MNHYLAAGLMGVSATVAVELVAHAFHVKSPNWKSGRWWIAWVAVMACAQVSFFLGVVAR